jgi:glycosyltransferase involved in cell wall biosynthesis
MGSPARLTASSRYTKGSVPFVEPVAAAQPAPLRLPVRALVVSGWFPPRPGGTAALMANLLQWFDPRDYVVATGTPPPDEPRARALAGARVRHVSRYRRVNGRGHQLWSAAQIPMAARRTARLARAEGAGVIVGVFPDLQHLTVAYLAHRLTGLPLAAYLHDFILEACYGGYLGALARWLHPRLLATAKPVWTMSEAMCARFAQVHGAPTRALVHPYNEPIPDEVPDAAPARGLRALFSGSVAPANGAALARVARALAHAGGRLTLLGPNPPATLARYGLDLPHVTPAFVADRAAVLSAMREHDVLVSTLSWPDESWVGEDEVATMFPTKLPEYLAQGRPVLAHCPAHYTMATFIAKHDCGWVVSERSEDAIATSLVDICADASARRTRAANALATARGFAGSVVAAQFRDELTAAVART